MQQPLILHPDSRCAAATRVDAGVTRPRPNALALHYVVTGRIDGLRMSAVTAPERSDDLWRHSCFEAFVRAAPGDAYYEFNFAPSTLWAAYRFSGYRAGMSVAGDIVTPRIAVRSGGEHFGLHATLDLDRLPDFPGDATWRLGLSAVIEEADGTLSYWALVHPPGKPDFHQSDCFALELPPA